MKKLVEKTTSIEVLMKDQLGLDYDKLAKNISKVNKMAWEQMLLLAIYARWKYHGDKASHFHSRMKMMKVLSQYQDNVISAVVLKHLDSGEGMISLVNVLHQHKDAEKNGRLNVAARLLSEIEEQQIAYSRLATPYLYSHYCLYKILFQPLDAFQQLLNLPPVRTLILQEVAYQLGNLKLNLHDALNGLHKSEDLVADVYENINYLNENNIVINTQLFTKNVISSLDKNIGSWMQTTFDLVLPNQNDSNAAANTTATPFEKMCKISQIDEKIVITLDKFQLSRLCYLGELDQIMSQMRKSLATMIDKQYDKNLKQTQIGPGSDLASWFEAVKTSWFNREDRIPRMVAVILEFDILHGLGFFENFSHSFRQPLNKSTSAKLTTLIIDHCLYKNGSTHDFGKGCINGHYNSRIEEFLPDETPQDHLASELMATWAQFDESKVKERFKRPRDELDKAFITITKDIMLQQTKAIDKTYPVNSVYPLPLWA